MVGGVIGAAVGRLWPAGTVPGMDAHIADLFDKPTVVAVGARHPQRHLLAQWLEAATARLTAGGHRVVRADGAGRPVTLGELSLAVTELAAAGGGVLVVESLSAVAVCDGGPRSSQVTGEWLAAVAHADLAAACAAGKLPWRLRPTRAAHAGVSVLAGTELRDHLDPSVIEFAGGTRLLAAAHHRFVLDGSGAVAATACR